MGFITPISDMLKRADMPKKSEEGGGLVTLMFSATFKPDVQSLAAEFLVKNHLFIQIGVLGGANEDVVQEIMQVNRS